MDAGLFFEPTRAEAEMLLRVVWAAAAGGAVGWNRHRAGKPAGVGTHALVALGAALFTAGPLLSGREHVDALSRVIQGVATGVGFLGAGEIFRDPGPGGSRITGLTSAAALWVTAALGIVIAVGSFVMSVSVTILILALLAVAPRLEHRFPTEGGAPPG